METPGKSTRERHVLAVILFWTVLTLANVAGYFFHPGVLWGVHLFGFLPLPFLLCHIVLSITAIIYCARGNVDKPVARLAQFMTRKPWQFLSIVIVLFIAEAYFFRVRVPLLGDSFLLSNNLQNTFRGRHLLHFSQEPIGFYYFYILNYLLGTTTYPGILTGFLLGEILLGIGFIINIYFIVRNTIEDEKIGFLIFVFLMSAPYMQILFGYVEIYSVVLFAISLNILFFVLTLNKKLSLSVVAPAFLLLVSVHYLAAMMAPSFFYLAYREYRQNGVANIFKGMLASAVLLVFLFWIVDFDVERFIRDVNTRHYLSIVGSDPVYQPYTLFSMYHAIDLANLLMLMCPWGLLLVLFAMKQGIHNILSTDLSRILLLSIAPFFLFLCLAKFDLGMAKDWDISSSFFLIVMFFASYVVSRPEVIGINVMGMVVIISFLNSLIYFQVNATPDSSVERAESLLDKRLLSGEGYYEGTFHLSMHYFYTREIDKMVQEWERFVQVYPYDIRGYQKLTKAQWERGENGIPDIVSTFERWRRLDTTNREMLHEYGSFCLLAGNTYAHEGKTSQAVDMFQRSIALDPSVPGAFNNLGLLYADSGDYDKAMACYQKAIEVDPAYAIGYKNLASARFTTGDPQTAIVLYQRAIQLDPTYTGAYESLAGVYLRTGDQEKAIPMYQQAARLGSPTAQQTLADGGYSW